MKAFWLVLLVLSGLGTTGPAAAQSCTASSTPLAFGAYTSPNGANVNSNASVVVSCTPAYLLLACRVSYTLSLSQGMASSNGQRQMAAGSGRLAYGLFSDPARTQAWGDGAGGGPAVAGSITTSLLALVCLPGQRVHTIHAQVPALQNVPPGLYSDQVTLTITY